MLVNSVTSQGNPVDSSLEWRDQTSQASNLAPDSNTSQEPSKLFRIHMKSGSRP